MVDPTTVNKALAIPTRGSDVGTWDTPVNGNMSIIDNSFGGLATIALTNAPVTLSAAQYQCAFLNFTGALSGNVAVTFPAVGSFYTVQNLTSNTSSFQVTFTTTAAGGQVIGCPWGQAIDIFTDGTNVKFRALGRVGEYWDYAGSSVPAWVTACTVPPYLNCDGTAFSSATYPVLATILGGTTLPDSKGRARSYLNQGTTRLTTAANGVDGNTLLAGGGGSVTLSSINIPNYTLPVTDPGHLHAIHQAGSGGIMNGLFGAGGTGLFTAGGAGLMGNSDSAVTNITVNSGGSGTPVTLATPTFIGGITMVRAA